jgi:NitT/TauT family transport system permease protein
MKKHTQRLTFLIFIVALIASWHFLSLGRETLIFPSPSEVLFSFVSVIKSKAFVPSVFNTVKSVFISFFVAFILSLVLGILSKFLKPLYTIMDKVSGIIRSVPSVAIILMALLLLPVSVTPIVICFFVVFPVLYTNIAEGLVSVDNKLIEMAKVYRISRKKIISGIYIPSLYTYLIAGIRSALGLSFKITVTAEVFNFVKQNTIGAQMYMHRIQIDIAGIIAWTIIVVAISLLFDYFLKKLFERRDFNA